MDWWTDRLVGWWTGTYRTYVHVEFPLAKLHNCFDGVQSGGIIQERQTFEVGQDL